MNFDILKTVLNINNEQINIFIGNSTESKQYFQENIFKNCGFQYVIGDRVVFCYTNTNEYLFGFSYTTSQPNPTSKYFIDIFDVCKSANISQLTNIRPRILFQNLIDYITKNANAHVHISLGVQFNNPSYDSLVEFYIKSGFGLPILTNELNGPVVIQEYFLRLDYIFDHVSQEDYSLIQKYSLDTCIWIKNIYNIYKKTLFTLVIDKSTNKIFNTFLSLDEEYAFQFNPNDSLIKQMIVKRGEGCGVEGFSDAVIYMHTHPRICYTQNNVSLGWPSWNDIGNDMTKLLQNKNYISIVCSVEGYYIQQFFPIVFKQYTDNEKGNFIVFIIFYFYRSMSYRNAEKFLIKLLSELNYMSYSRMTEIFIKYLQEFNQENINGLLPDIFNTQIVQNSDIMRYFIKPLLQNKLTTTDIQTLQTSLASLNIKPYHKYPILTITLSNSFIKDENNKKDTIFAYNFIQ
jgi:hypothetical protein